MVLGDFVQEALTVLLFRENMSAPHGAPPKVRRTQSAIYHEASAIANHELLLGNADSHRTDRRNLRIEFKSFPGSRKTALLRAIPLSRNFWQILSSRRSVREFSRKGISLFELSTLLLSIGIVTAKPSAMSSGPWEETRRPYPSAGARYPIEVYPIIIESKELGSGIYHYNVKQHALELLTTGSFRDSLVRATGEQWAAEAHCALILTAIFERSQTKYSERGYRYALMEAGHLMQNICLAAEALQLGLCPCGGFVDAEINSLLGVDGTRESAIYMGFLGARRLGLS